MITNQVTLVGYVGTKPEYKKTQDNQHFIIFSLKTLETFKNKEGKLQTKTNWHRVSVWGENIVPVIFQNIHKDDKVRLEGKLKNKEWINKFGTKSTSYEIAINDHFGSCLLIPSLQEEGESIEIELADFYNEMYAFEETCESNE